MKALRKVMVANRGEIALRVMQAVHELGLQAVAVYADSDAHAPHVAAADEAYPLHGRTPAESYLNIEKILHIAAEHEVDAVHPGYGFLSENAEFAERCAQSGMTFIGPAARVIRAMGDKIVAKNTMREAGVPVVPGAVLPPDDLDAWRKAAEEIGYPVLLKAAAGGGGKGMRVVSEAAGLANALESASREAAKAFGDDRVFMEKYLRRPRHIEVQVFGDSHGNVVHLFERECSIQRRHQKIVEEAPATRLDDDARHRLGEAAVKAARAVEYSNAGTVEFIMDEDGSFYFMEMNTRLQVEHGVTELMLGFDLVRAQLRVATGEPLPFTQDDVRPQAHAIECRIYAEDPANNFLPATGVVARLRLPRGPGIRVDCGIAEGFEVTVHHDPMLAKLLTWGRTRGEALDKMRFALQRFVVLGVTNNIGFLQTLMSHEAFVAGEIHTHFLQEHPLLTDVTAPSIEALVAAAALQQCAAPTRNGTVVARFEGPWAAANGWRTAR